MRFGNTYLKPIGKSWPAEIPCRPIDARSVDRYFLFLPHPSWIKRQHDHSLERQRRYVAGFAARIAVGFRQPLIKIARSTVIDALLRPSSSRNREPTVADCVHDSILGEEGL